MTKDEIDKLLEGVEMPEAHQLFTERCGHFVVTADQLRETVAAAVLRKDAEIANLHTVMMAAAVEITEHWDAHCDEEGYGPANLVRRLENGYPAQYGYDAKTLVRIEVERDALKAENERGLLDAMNATRAFIKHSVEQSDDWSDWVCPDPKSYMMKCCDCGLVHEAQFKVVRYKSETEREDCDVVEDPNLQAVFRMRRSEQWTPEDMAHRPGGLTEADALKAELAQRDAHIVEYNVRIQAEMMKLLDEKDALKAENEKLRGAMQSAYCNGNWNSAMETLKNALKGQP